MKLRLSDIRYDPDRKHGIAFLGMAVFVPLMIASLLTSVEPELGDSAVRWFLLLGFLSLLIMFMAALFGYQAVVVYRFFLGQQKVGGTKKQIPHPVAVLSLFCLPVSLVITIFSMIYWLLDGVRGVVKEDSITGYEALYFSTITFTTLGYGDLQPMGLTRFVAGIEALMGYLLLGCVVGAVMAVISARINTG